MIRLKDNKNFFIDGSFIRPLDYLQTIILLYYDEITKIFVPRIIILANNKLESNYTEILKFVSSSLLLTNFNDKNITIICDYETGMINLIKKIFPKAIIVGCFFH